MAEPTPVPAPPPAQKMYRADGTEVYVPPEQVRDAYLSGQAGFKEGQEVIVTGRDGTPRPLSAADADAWYRSIDGAVGTTIPAEVYARQQEAKEYGGVGAGVGAFAAEAANAATLGGAGLALRAVAPGVADEAEKAIQYNPNAALAGTVAGAIAPALLTGGGSAAAEGAVGVGGLARGAARVATAPARAATALGTAAEAATARGLLSLGAAEGGALVRVGSKAVGQAFEGGLQAVGMAAGDAALKDEPITAEKLVAAGLMGGALGGLVGGGLEGVSIGAERAFDAGRRAIGGLAKAVEGEQSALAKVMGGKASAVFDDVATRKAVQSTGASLSKIEELAARGDAAVRRVAKIVQEDLPSVTGRKSLAGGAGKGAMSHAEMAEAADVVRKRAGKAMGDLLGTLDDAAKDLESKGVPAVNVRPDVGHVVAEARTTVLDPLRQQVFRKGEARQLEELIDDLATKGQGLSLKELQAKRSNLDDKIFEAKTGGNKPLRESYLKVRDLLETEIGKTADRIASQAGLGSGFATKYEAAKMAYADAKWVADATAKGSAREATNRSFGLSEQFGMLSGLAYGGLTGGAMGVAGAMAQNYARRFGDQLIATTAARAAKDGALRAIAQTVDDAVGGAVGRFFGKAPEKAIAAKAAAVSGSLKSAARAAIGQQRLEKATLAERYKKERDELAARQAASGAHLARWTAPVADVNPKLALRVAGKAAQVDANIAAKFAETQRGAGYTPGVGRERTPSPAEMDRILRYVDGARDPIGVLKEIGDGKLDRQKIEALKANYPEIFREVQSQALQGLTELKRPLPYQKTVQLGLLLDVPADGTLEPDFIATQQQTYADASGPPQDTAGPMPASRPAPRISKAFTTRGDALAAGESLA